MTLAYELTMRTRSLNVYATRPAAVREVSPQNPDMLTAVMTSDRDSVAYYLAQGVDIDRIGNGSTYLMDSVGPDDQIAKASENR